MTLGSTALRRLAWLIGSVALITGCPKEKQQPIALSGSASFGDGGADNQTPDGGAVGDPIDLGLGGVAQQNTQGMIAVGPPAKLDLAPGGATTIPLELEAGRCYTIIGYANQAEIQHLGLSLLIEPLKMNVEAPGATPTPVLGAAPGRVCMPTGLGGTIIPVKLTVSARQGGGRAGVQVFAMPGGAAPTTPTTPTTPAGDPAGVLLESTATKLASGMSPEGAAQTFALAAGEQKAIAITMQGGKCYSVIAVSPKGDVDDIGMTLFAPPLYNVKAGEDTRRDNIAVLGGSKNPVCPITPIPIGYRLNLVAKKGAGTVAFRVYSKIGH